MAIVRCNMSKETSRASVVSSGLFDVHSLALSGITSSKHLNSRHTVLILRLLGEF